MYTDKLLTEAKQFLQEAKDIKTAVEDALDYLFAGESFSVEQDRYDRNTVYIYGFDKQSFKFDLNNGDELLHTLKRKGNRWAGRAACVYEPNEKRIRLTSY